MGGNTFSVRDDFGGVDGERLMGTSSAATAQLDRRRVDGRLIGQTDVRALDLRPIELVARASVAAARRSRRPPTRRAQPAPGIDVFTTLTNRRLLIGLDRDGDRHPARVAASLAFDDITMIGRKRCWHDGRRAVELRLEVGHRGALSLVIPGRGGDLVAPLIRQLADRRFTFTY